MKTKKSVYKTAITSVLLAILLLSFGTAYSQCCGGSNRSSCKTSANNTAGNESEAVFYECPMHADITSKTPANCTKCGMALEKKSGITSITSNNNGITETFGVKGKCGMCKTTIESALKNKKGIISCTWDLSTNKLSVTYIPETITIEKIHQLVADAGYDTDKIKASDKAYNKLPACCQYQRN
ncbi:MAG: cation transporter [Bacteroidales bacterium]|jgi:copper chaperone CopZ|nr:cation transporter [Bacteroidales bacterium]